MNAAAFPLKLFLNLDRRTDRRERCEAMFAGLGWSVERMAAVDARRLKSARGFESSGRYAHAVSTRLMLRRAALAGAEAVLLMEDDVVFHPALAQRLAELELPADWGIFYLGCQQCERPEVVSPGVVRVRAPLDTHAWAVRREYFLDVRRALRGRFWPKGGGIPNADLLLAELTRRVPAYAAFPNLAWQEENESDLAGGHYANYDADGRQIHNRECLRGLLAEALGGKSHPPAAAAAGQQRGWFWHSDLRTPPGIAPEPPVVPLRDGEKVAFLFLTTGPHLHDAVWEEYWRGQEDRVSIFAHTAEAASLHDGWLREAQIGEHVETAWADVSLVRAQMALLRAALHDERNRFFVFASESCVPVRPLADLLRLLRIDGRSRFPWAAHEEAEEYHPQKAARAPLEGRIPPGDWRFHPQWVLLSREAAALLVANAALVECFAGTYAPDEAAFGTILHAAGYPLLEKVALQAVTWTRWMTEDAPQPEFIAQPDAATMGEIAASGCYFARKFAPGCGVEAYGLHLPP
jgi:Core-2/I-Branching enzyme